MSLYHLVQYQDKWGEPPFFGERQHRQNWTWLEFADATVAKFIWSNRVPSSFFLLTAKAEERLLKRCLQLRAVRWSTSILVLLRIRSNSTNSFGRFREDPTKIYLSLKTLL